MSASAGGFDVVGAGVASGWFIRFVSMFGVLSSKLFRSECGFKQCLEHVQILRLMSGLWRPVSAGWYHSVDLRDGHLVVAVDVVT